MAATSSARDKSAKRGSAASLKIPLALLAYLAGRCDDAEAILRDVLVQIPEQGHGSIPSGPDKHNGLRACSLKATIVLSRWSTSVQAVIVADDWTVVANTVLTDLTIHFVPDIARTRLEGGRLCDFYDLGFLPSDLVVSSVIDDGPGATLRCQPAVTTIDFGPESGFQGLSDVCGRVSGSDAGF